MRRNEEYAACSCEFLAKLAQMGVEDMKVMDSAPFIAVRSSKDYGFDAGFAADPAAAAFPRTVGKSTRVDRALTKAASERLVRDGSASQFNAAQYSITASRHSSSFAFLAAYSRTPLRSRIFKTARQLLIRGYPRAPCASACCFQ